MPVYPGAPSTISPVRGDQDAAALVALGQQCKQYFHLLSALLNVSEVVDHKSFVVGQLLNRLAQPQFFFGAQEFLNKPGAGNKADLAAIADQFLAEP
jgi:hypothetical protein